MGNNFRPIPDAKLIDRAKKVGLLNDWMFTMKIQQYFRNPDDVELSMQIEERIRKHEIENTINPKPLISNLPIRDDCIGEICLGNHSYTGAEVKLSLEEIGRSNVLVAGSCRKGKSTLMSNVVNQLNPFLNMYKPIIFTQKTNLRALAMSSGLFLFVINHKMFKMNPFLGPPDMKHKDWFTMPLVVKKLNCGQKFSTEVEIAVCSRLTADYGIDSGSEIHYGYEDILDAIKHKRYDLSNFKETYIGTIYPTYESIIASSMCGVYDCSKPMNLRYILDRGALFELPAYWTTTQVRMFVEHIVQWAFMDRDTRPRSTHIIFFCDDAQLLLPPYSEISWLASVFPVAVERNITFWLIIHVPHLVNDYFFSNADIKIVFGLDDGKDKEVMAKALDINLRDEVGVFDQPAGKFILKNTNKPILCEEQDLKISSKVKTDEEAAVYMEPAYNSSELSWQPRVRYEELQKARASMNSCSTSNTKVKPLKLSNIAELIARDVQNPAYVWDTKEQRFNRFTITSGSKKVAISEELTITFPFIKEWHVNGYGTLWEPLPEYYKYFNNIPHKLRGKGSYKCKFIAYIICQNKGLNPNTAIEYCINGKTIDVVQRNDNKLIGYEIESKESKGVHAESNCIQDILNCRLDELIFACETPMLMKKIKEIIKNNTEIESYINKIKFVQWSVFLPRKESKNEQKQEQD